jgi:hypothetical protein
MLLNIPTQSGEAKGELELAPPEELVRSRGSEAELRLMFTKSNRVVVQDVFVQPFSENVAPTVLEKLSANIVAPLQHRWRQAPEFKVLTARLTCIPDSGCRFTWLRISFELGDEAQAELRPVACKLYPESSQDAIKLKSSVEISGELSIHVGKTGTKGTKGVEHDRYEYNIKAYGTFGPSPAWDFQKTPVHPEITGDLVLLMVIAAPPATTSSGELKISARAELESSPIVIPLITRRTSDNAAAMTFSF